MIIDRMNIDEIPVRIKILAGAALFFLLTLGTSAYYFGWLGTNSNDGGSQSAQAPATVVEVAQANRMTMAPHTVLPGTIVSVTDSVIAAETSGKILSIANIGDVIEKGGKIAEIDSSDAQQLVDQRSAELQRLKSLHSYHSDYYERVGVEENTLGVPEVVIAELRSNRDTAKADVARAAAALASAQNDLDRTTIRAPFAGRVVSQEIQTGEYAQIGGAIARLVDTDNLEVSARVPASLVQPIEAGTLLEITGMGKSLQAPMRALVPVGDAVSRTMELRVELKDSGLLVGSPVRVSLPSAQAREVVAIPRDAVILRTDSQFVFVIDQNKKAHRREVELGYAEGAMIEVVGDVDYDATVVIRGGERLRDGQTVKWSESTASSSGAISQR